MFVNAVCPVNSLQLLSYNRELLPLENVKATSEDEPNPLEQFVVAHGNPWCSARNDVDSPNLHINLTFTEPVVVTFIESSGFYNAYVDEFSIEHAPEAEAVEFQSYGVLEDNQVHSIFIITIILGCSLQ